MMAGSNFTVNQATDDGTGNQTGTLSWAIKQANLIAGDDTITLTTNVRVTAEMKTLVNSNITIIGGGNTISGDANNDGVTNDGDVRPLFIYSGNVNISNLTITNGMSKGGDSQGGGAAGMGGGLFIYDGNVSLSNVTFSNNQAIGGSHNRNSSGNGKMGSIGGLSGYFGPGEAGIGSPSSNGNPGSGTSSSNGDGGNGDGGNGGNGGYGKGGNGGFGGNGGNGNGGFGYYGGNGKGGNGGFGGNGGNGYGGYGYYGGNGNGGFGGFGGGGGNGDNGGNGGNGGYGGGGGSYYGGGGGGAGMGGAIFIRSGSLTLQNTTFNNNTAQGGTGGNNGQGLGGAIFIMQSTENTNGNNQGMPTTLPTVTSVGTPTFNGNNAADDADTQTNNNDIFGAFSTPPGVIITQSNGSTDVTEGGATDTYTVALNSQPTSNVTININPGTQTTTNTTSLTFTAANWNVAQTVTVNAVDDAVAEGNHTGTIQHTVTSDDANYNGFTVAPITVNITDNDPAIPPIQGTSGKDILNGTASDDIINGLDGNDYIFGRAGNDTLDGGIGTDYVSGGDGDDIINGGDGSDFLYGNAGNDTLNGGEGGDNLDGGAGVNTLAGGIGNDIYTVNSINDQVIEVDGEGTDKINSSITWDLNNNANVENLTLTGNAALNGTGNTLNNHIIGNNAVNNLNGGIGNDWLMGKGGNDNLIGGEGNDRLDGGTGNDLLEGGAGNDQYEVDSLGDVIIEAADAGIDTVFSLVNWNLSPNSNLENLTLVGSQTINGQGNELANQINGNSANNILEGLAGNDRLSGGAGNDLLIGGAGFDRLEGGRGEDIFDLSGTSTTGFDTIADFKVGEDIVRLDVVEFQVGAGTFDSGLLSLGINATSSTQRFVYNQITGALFYDADGNGIGEKLQIAQFSSRAALTADSFELFGNIP